MKRRDPHQWAKTRNHDEFFIKAKKEGYRARSAYKLIEINEKYNIIPKQGRILDLGAAPGAWLQVLKKHSNAIVEGIDLLAIHPIDGINTLKADIFSQEVQDFLKDEYDLILSDMAPNSTGRQELDHILIINLLEQVLQFAQKHLKIGGTVCCKVYDGFKYLEFFQEFKKHFHTTKRIKPKASRLDNSEFYLVGMKFISKQ